MAQRGITKSSGRRINTCEKFCIIEMGLKAFQVIPNTFCITIIESQNIIFPCKGRKSSIALLTHQRIFADRFSRSILLAFSHDYLYLFQPYIYNIAQAVGCLPLLNLVSHFKRGLTTPLNLPAKSPRAPSPSMLSMT